LPRQKWSESRLPRTLCSSRSPDRLSHIHRALLSKRLSLFALWSLVLLLTFWFFRQTHLSRLDSIPPCPPEVSLFRCLFFFLKFTPFRYWVSVFHRPLPGCWEFGGDVLSRRYQYSLFRPLFPCTFFKVSSVQHVFCVLIRETGTSHLDVSQLPCSPFRVYASFWRQVPLIRPSDDAFPF